MALAAVLVGLWIGSLWHERRSFKLELQMTRVGDVADPIQWTRWYSGFFNSPSPGFRRPCGYEPQRFAANVEMWHSLKMPDRRNNELPSNNAVAHRHAGKVTSYTDCDTTRMLCMSEQGPAETFKDGVCESICTEPAGAICLPEAKSKQRDVP